MKELAALGYTAELVSMEDEVHVRAGAFSEFKHAKAFREELVQAGFTRAFATRTYGTASAAGKQQEESEGLQVEEGTAPGSDPSNGEEPIRRPEDAPARDAHLSGDAYTDPGCVLMTKGESLALLEANRIKRQELTQELDELQDELARLKLTVCIGSFRAREQAELAAAEAGRRGINLDVRQMAAGGWVAAVTCDSEAQAGQLQQRLADAGLTNAARLLPLAGQLSRITELEASLRHLDWQDSVARECLAQYRY